MKRIAIYGAGGLGREISCLISIINENQDHHVWEFIGFFDDNIAKGSDISHFGICLGGLDEVNRWEEPLDLCIAISDGKIKESLSQKIANSYISFPNIIHPDFTCTDKAGFKIGQGNIIQGGCAVTTDVTIGNFNLLNGGIIIGHDTVMGDFNTLMGGTRISGDVTIGNRNSFGTYSTVLQRLMIKNDTTLAMCSALMNNPKEGKLYMGVPARKTEF